MGPRLRLWGAQIRFWLANRLICRPEPHQAYPRRVERCGVRKLDLPVNRGIACAPEITAGWITPNNSEVDRTDNVEVHPVDVDEKAIVSRCSRG